MIHLIQSDPEVPPGLISMELDRLSVPWNLFRLDRGEPLPACIDTTGVIVLGGRMSANGAEDFPFLDGLKLFIRDSVSRGIPYLGICLGGQLLAAACGADVAEMRWGERGCIEVMLSPEGCRDRLFFGIDSRFITFQWHDDSFDLPEGATLLASSKGCPHQAFRFGSAAWGLQFHPEVTPAIIESWTSSDASREDDNSSLLADWSRNEAEYRRVASRIIENFLKF